jgi:hypothetical protein
MSKSIPQDVENFLYTLGTCDQIAPGAFEQYARTAATLLWEKYVMFQDASIDVDSNTRHGRTASPKPRQN